MEEPDGAGGTRCRRRSGRASRLPGHRGEEGAMSHGGAAGSTG